jgi:hypothetical protein
MSRHWYTDMALLRIGPETEVVARQLSPGVYHHIGCLCPECTEIRAAVGGSRMDEDIAAVMETRERGRIAAGQEITAQRRREADARAEVTREMAGYGAYPYRVAREAAQEFLDGAVHSRGTGCTCRPPAWNPGSPYWAAHNVDCPMRARLCAEAARKARQEKPGRPAARIAREICVKDEFTRCGCRDCTAPPALANDEQGLPFTDPVQEIRAALAEYDTWRLNGPVYPPELCLLPGQHPTGKCRECHLGDAMRDSLCYWCLLAQQVAREKPRKPARGAAAAAVSAVLTILVTALGCFLTGAALSGYSVLLLPGLLLMAAGVARAWKR